VLLRRGLGFGNCQLRHLFDNPVEVCLANGVQVRIRHGVHEVDGIGNAVFDGKLDGIEFVAQRVAKLERVQPDVLQQPAAIARRLRQVALGVRFARVIGHDADLFLPTT